MNHTIQQIIDNQSKYKKEIINFLKNELVDIVKELSEIKTNDEYIIQEKNKLKKKLSQTKFIKSAESLFFLSKKRSEEYYVWWDENLQEAITLTYGKK